jgi:phytoene synthase
VGEDARAGRLYLPVSWLREAGIDPEHFLRYPAYTPALRRIVARLLAEAERLYAQAEAGIAHLPVGCRPAIHAARLLYAEIGRAAGAEDFDPVARRAVVPGRRKGALVLRALPASLRPARALDASTPAAIHALLAISTPLARHVPKRATNPVVTIIDLFAALEARQYGAEHPLAP